MTEPRRRSARALKWLCAAGVTLAAAVPLAAPAEAQTGGGGSAFSQKLEGRFVDPDRIYSTDVRWWLGDASHTDETLLEEIQALYDGGFRGVELCMQNDSAAADATYGYGSPQWTHKWNLMMNKFLDLGMGVYLTSGTNWSTSNVPGLDPTSQAAMQNLTLGTGTVTRARAWRRCRHRRRTRGAPGRGSSPRTPTRWSRATPWTPTASSTWRRC